MIILLLYFTIFILFPCKQNYVTYSSLDQQKIFIAISLGWTCMLFTVDNAHKSDRKGLYLKRVCFIDKACHNFTNKHKNRLKSTIWIRSFFRHDAISQNLSRMSIGETTEYFTILAFLHTFMNISRTFTLSDIGNKLAH